MSKIIDEVAVNLQIAIIGNSITVGTNCNLQIFLHNQR
jgi:hypothetical protein